MSTPEAQAHVTERQASCRRTFAAGRIPPMKQTGERQRLVTELGAAEKAYRRRPWDNGAEVGYQTALEALLRFEGG